MPHGYTAYTAVSSLLSGIASFIIIIILLMKVGGKFTFTRLHLTHIVCSWILRHLKIIMVHAFRAESIGLVGTP